MVVVSSCFLSFLEDKRVGDRFKRPKIAEDHNVQWWWVGGIVGRVRSAAEGRYEHKRDCMREISEALCRLLCGLECIE